MRFSSKFLYHEKAVFTIDIASSEAPVSYMIKGCIKALKNFPKLELILIGDQKVINHHFRMHRRMFKRVEIIHTTQIIAMNENPAKACIKKNNSSVMLAAETVKNKKSFGFYSPGNTGATVVSSILKLGLLKNIKKPAIITPLPTIQGRTFLLDSGATVDVTPDIFYSFAKLGRSFFRAVFGKSNLKIGLLNIGIEENKGSKIIKESYKMLKNNIKEFYGNIEGNDMFSGKSDIILCDGFVGNIIVKMNEGLGKEIIKRMKIRRKNQKKRLSEQNKHLQLLDHQIISRKLKKITDSENYGGAPLLGVNGLVLIGHGRGKSRAVFNAIRNALYYESKKLIPKMIKDFNL